MARPHATFLHAGWRWWLTRDSSWNQAPRCPSVLEFVAIEFTIGQHAVIESAVNGREVPMALFGW